MARVEKLSEDELRNELDTLDGWSLQNGKLHRSAISATRVMKPNASLKSWNWNSQCLERRGRRPLDPRRGWRHLAGRPAGSEDERDRGLTVRQAN